MKKAATIFEQRETAAAYYAAGVDKTLIIDQLVNLGYPEGEAPNIYQEQFAELGIDARIDLLNSFPTNDQEVTMTKNIVAEEIAAVSINDVPLAETLAPHFDGAVFIGDFFEFDAETGMVVIGHPEAVEIHELSTEDSVLPLITAAADMLLIQKYSYITDKVHAISNPRDIQHRVEDAGVARGRNGWVKINIHGGRYEYDTVLRHKVAQRKHNFMSDLFNGTAYTFNVKSLRTSRATKRYMKALGYGRVNTKDAQAYYDAIVTDRLAMNLENAQADYARRIESKEEKDAVYREGKENGKDVQVDDFNTWLSDIGVLDAYNDCAARKVRLVRYKVVLNGSTIATVQPISLNSGHMTWWKGLFARSEHQSENLVVTEVSRFPKS